MKVVARPLCAFSGAPMETMSKVTLSRSRGPIIGSFTRRKSEMASCRCDRRLRRMGLGDDDRRCFCVRQETWSPVRALLSVTLVALLISVGTAAADDRAFGKPAPKAAVFPLHVAPGKRYLVDSAGMPFLLVGDSPSSLAVRLTQ